MLADDTDRHSRVTSAYYQQLHNSSAYQTNNWLLPEIDRVLACQPNSLLEIGFGNGRFLREAAARVERVIGVDWVESPIAREMPPNVEVIVADVTKHDLPLVDLACSADVLEHFHPNDIDRVISRLHGAAPHNFHVIACYDDGHSHLSIFEPEEWLLRFRQVATDYQIIDVRKRRGDERKKICLITNYAQ